MFQGKIKKSEKLPRGTYFYIRVGDRFYAGEEAVIEESVVATPKDHYRDWRTPTPGRWYRGAQPTQIRRDHAKYYEKRDGRPVPEYWLEPEKEPRPTKKAVTGKKPGLTDEFKDVKQFRRLNQAELACDRLKAMYAGLDIKCVIELHEGDK